MKKILALVAFAAVSFASFAEKGDLKVGLDMGPVPVIEKNVDLTNFELGGRVQYSVTDEFRVQARLGYSFASKTISIFNATAEAQYVIPVVDKFSLYPLVGIGIGTPHTSVWGGDTDTRFIFNIGLGGEVAFTDHWGAFIEFKYQYMSDFQRFPIAVGVSYKF